MAADTTKKHFIRIRGANVNNLKNQCYNCKHRMHIHSQQPIIYHIAEWNPYVLGMLFPGLHTARHHETG